MPGMGAGAAGAIGRAVSVVAAGTVWVPPTRINKAPVAVNKR